MLLRHNQGPSATTPDRQCDRGCHRMSRRPRQQAEVRDRLSQPLPKKTVVILLPKVASDVDIALRALPFGLAPAPLSSWHIHLLTRAGRLMRARSEPVRGSGDGYGHDNMARSPILSNSPMARSNAAYMCSSTSSSTTRRTSTHGSSRLARTPMGFSGDDAAAPGTQQPPSCLKD
jgi:hypothetical protein